MSKEKLKKPKVKQIIIGMDGKPIDTKDPERIKKGMKKAASGAMIGGGKKNYKTTGMLGAKTGKLVGGQKNLPGHLKKAILA